MSAERRCAKCRNVKPVDDFYPDRNQSTGRDYYCKPCRLADTRTRRNPAYERQRWAERAGEARLLWGPHGAKHASRRRDCAECHRLGRWGVPEPEPIVEPAHQSSTLLGPLPCHTCRQPVIVLRSFRVADVGTEDAHQCRVVTVGEVRSERCACGGWIVVRNPTDRSIEAAVQRHQESAGHRQWWQDGGFDRRRKRAA